MKEKLYTIPLMDAFKAEDECPFCFVERQLEQHAMDFVLGAGASVSVFPFLNREKTEALEGAKILICS